MPENRVGASKNVPLALALFWFGFRAVRGGAHLDAMSDDPAKSIRACRLLPPEGLRVRAGAAYSANRAAQVTNFPLKIRPRDNDDVSRSPLRDDKNAQISDDTGLIERDCVHFYIIQHPALNFGRNALKNA